jgi:hypothetical protein
MSEVAGGLGRRIAEQLGALTLEKVLSSGLENAKANLSAIKSGKSLAALLPTDVLGKQDALVIAAGPSIHRFETARIIKDSEFKGIIVATESSMAWCLRHNIVPDLVVTLDPHSERIVRWFGDPDLNEKDLIRDDYYSRQDMDPKFRENQLSFNRELINLVNQYGPRMKIAVASSASFAVVRRAEESGMDVYWWNPMYDDYEVSGSITQRLYQENGLPCLNAGGNVGTACWVIAHALLGIRRVGLVGMDFGYYADTPYDRTQYYKEVLALVGKEFIKVRNPYLESDFYTDPAYLWYRDSFLEMAAEAECQTVNCTNGGILFGPNISWSDLSAFLSGT